MWETESNMWALRCSADLLILNYTTVPYDYIDYLVHHSNLWPDTS